MTLRDFENGYWYVERLKNFAEHIGIPATKKLRKDKLEKAIVTFLRTGKAALPTTRSLRRIRLFGFITDRMIRSGTFHCVEELETAIYQWLANWNQEPDPFVWKATADVILDKVDFISGFSILFRQERSLVILVVPKGMADRSLGEASPLEGENYGK